MKDKIDIKTFFDSDRYSQGFQKVNNNLAANKSHFYFYYDETNNDRMVKTKGNHLNLTKDKLISDSILYCLPANK